MRRQSEAATGFGLATLSKIELVKAKDKYEGLDQPPNPKRCRAALATALQSTGYSRRDFLSTAIAAPALVATLPIFATAAGDVVVSSPDGKVSFHLLRDQSQLRHRVSFNRREFIESSQMGIVVDGIDFGRDIAIGKVDRYSIREAYPTRGVHSEAANNCHGTRVAITHLPSKTTWILEVRAYNDGIAFRYIVPGSGSRVPDEGTTFTVPGAPPPALSAKRTQSDMTMPFGQRTSVPAARRAGEGARAPGLKLIRLLTICAVVLLACRPIVAQRITFDVARFDRARILKAANEYLSNPPITITASHSPRSAGGIHDFFSEGDYWWPDSQNPGGPYIQRDGMSNPDNFVEHRRALMRLSVQVPALSAAWLITKDNRYAKHAAQHLRAWFLDTSTRMNPNLQYAQAIHGRFTGRGIGIIDTIHLVEVARAIEVLRDSSALSMTELGGINQWFTDYLQWMTTSKNGIEEREAKNNHGTCWVMQVAAFAHLVGDEKLLAYCRDRFKTVIVPNQIAVDGSFPQELRRTKPYGYSLFNLEAMATVCQILSTPADNLWTFESPDGRSMRQAMEYMAPFIRDKKTWPLKADVMYDSEWPMRQSSLLFAGLALGRADYLALWKKLPADSRVEEVIRNFFVRQPVLWV